MDAVTTFIAICTAAGGGAGLDRLLHARQEGESMAVETLKMVLEELRTELIHKASEIEHLQSRLDVATGLVERMVEGDLPDHLS